MLWTAPKATFALWTPTGGCHWHPSGCRCQMGGAAGSARWWEPRVRVPVRPEGVCRPGASQAPLPSPPRRRGVQASCKHARPQTRRRRAAGPSVSRPHSPACVLWSGCLCGARYLFCVVTTTVVVFVGASTWGLLDFFQEKGSRTAMSDSSPLITLTSRNRPMTKLEKQSSSSSLQRPGLLGTGRSAVSHGAGRLRTLALALAQWPP